MRGGIGYDRDKIREAATLIVAASDSLHPERADYVCSGTNDHITIMQAISDLPANGGHVVLLDGIYDITGAGANEGVGILKSGVWLSGQGYNTVIVATSVSENVGVYIHNVTGCIVENLRVYNSGGDGIELTRAHRSIVCNCWVEDCAEEGIVLYFTNNAKVHGNYISNCAPNIQLFGGGCDYNVIEGNIIDGNGATNGIELPWDGANFPQHNTIINNIMFDCHSPIWMDKGQYNTVSGNIIHTVAHTYTVEGGNHNTYSGNIINCAPRTAFYNVGPNSIIDSNIVTCGAGISGTAHECVIVNNTFIATGGTAITPGSDSIISNNNIYGFTNGIYIDNAIRCVISGNHVESCTHSIRELGTSGENIYVHNILTNNTYIFYSGISPTSIAWKVHSDLFMDVLAVSATHVRSNEDLSEAIPNTFTLDAQPDVPRTLSGHFDAHAQITAYTIVITGVDAKGNTVTETFTEAASPWDFETVNAYATITSLIMTARTGTGAGDTMDIGITDVLGLSNIIYATGDVFKIKKNNANAAVAAAQVDTDYDTYDMAVIGLAGGDDFTIWFKSNLNIIS